MASAGAGQGYRCVGQNGFRRRFLRRAAVGQHPGNPRYLRLRGQVRSVSHAALYRGLQDKRQALAGRQRRNRPDAVRIGRSVGRRCRHIFNTLRKRDCNGRIGGRSSAGVGKRNRILQRFTRRGRGAAGGAVKQKLRMLQHHCFLRG